MLPQDPQDAGRHTYLSGSEEKVLRVMEAPQAFLDTWAAATGWPPAPASSQVGLHPEAGQVTGNTLAPVTLMGTGAALRVLNKASTLCVALCKPAESQHASFIRHVSLV